ncbi:hypothetical protein K8T06_14095, partial [bacterium]|nr:hypothetical protein [bacterium]
DRLILGWQEFKQMSSLTGVLLNTDDKPHVEFNAPKSLYRDTVSENKKSILLFKTENAQNIQN